MKQERALLVLARGQPARGGGRAPEDEGTSPFSLEELAHSLAASPAWGSIGPATLVVREEPEPLLAVIGDFDGAARARLSTLSWQLRRGLPRVVDYAQAERDCERLADLLRERLDAREIANAHFVGLPRGGLIVLGMLAYALDLKPWQLQASPTSVRPVVIVDDCALTGFRFGGFLRRLASRQVVFATLYAPADLLRAIEAREPAVRMCLSAHDLADLAPAALGSEYEAWQVRTLSRLRRPRYWVGQTEPIAFAWSEPETGVWNPSTGKTEVGWRLAPEQSCLRSRRDRVLEGIEVQRVPGGSGPIRPAPSTLYAEQENRILVGNVDDGRCCVLEEIAADLWRAILQEGTREGATNRLLEIYDAPESVLHQDVDSFTSELIARGLLEEDDAPGSLSRTG